MPCGGVACRVAGSRVRVTGRHAFHSEPETAPQRCDARMTICHLGGVPCLKSSSVLNVCFQVRKQQIFHPAATRPPSFHFKAAPLTAGYAPLPPSLTKLTIGLPQTRGKRQCQLKQLEQPLFQTTFLKNGPLCSPPPTPTPNRPAPS